MLDRSDAPGAPVTTDAASRRAFRSRVDSIRPTYGFEDVSLAPGTDTVEPADVDLSTEIAGIRLPIPVLAAAMDAVVDARFAGALAALGGLAVLNLEGVQTRFDDPDVVLERIATAPDGDIGDVLAEAYGAPLREDLVARRIAEIHAAGSRAAISATPAAARRWGPFCAEHGADMFLVQSQVSSARHLATGYEPLALADFTRYMPIPVAVGNTTNAEAAYALMEQGAAAVFVGVGPGAACTTREVLGIGVPQVTAISDVAAAATPISPTPAATSPSSATAGCAAAVRSPRRSRRARTRSCSDRRSPEPRRRPGAAPTGAWPRRRPRSRAACGSGWGPPGRWSGSSSGRRT